MHLILVAVLAVAGAMAGGAAHAAEDCDARSRLLEGAVQHHEMAWAAEIGAPYRGHAPTWSAEEMREKAVNLMADAEKFTCTGQMASFEERLSAAEARLDDHEGRIGSLEAWREETEMVLAMMKSQVYGEYEGQFPAGRITVTVMDDYAEYCWWPNDSVAAECHEPLLHTSQAAGRYLASTADSGEREAIWQWALVRGSYDKADGIANRIHFWYRPTQALKARGFRGGKTVLDRVLYDNDLMPVVKRQQHRESEDWG